MIDDPFERAVARTEAAAEQEDAERRRRRQARSAAGQRKAFRIHLTVFLSVNLLIIVIWLLTWTVSGGTSYPWFLFVLLGWGIGLAAHWATVHDHYRRRKDGHE